MRTLSALAVSSALVLLSACGGGDSIEGPGEQPGDGAGEQPILDFAPIAGAWAGWGAEPSVQFWIRASLNSSARQGETVGSIEYGLSDPDDEPNCGGEWIANNADHPVYVVAERITFGGCPDGRVRLELDSETGELSYDFTPDEGEAGAEGEGTLIPGTDPGPKP